MFGLFDSVEKKMRANASNWLELADKIYHYRRDELKESERLQLKQRTEALRGQLRDKADASNLKLGIESLEEVLRRTGGTFYPKSTLQEYVEFLLVAAIVVLGVRTYFVQPFKIPTNSMWPTYYGMTPQAYPDPKTAPGPLAKAVRFILFGAQHHEVVPTQSGTVNVPVVMDQRGQAHVWGRKTRGRKWFFIPTDVNEYVFLINRTEQKFTLPADFDFDKAFCDSLGLSEKQFADAALKGAPISDVVRLMAMNRRAEAGKPLISFDILTGDQLFVDRFSYHFFAPKVGDGFVFRTDGIERIGSNQYFIKRLVGLPGDTLEVHAPVLYRNGAPIMGAKAFEKNAKQVSPYRGYSNYYSLDVGQKVSVPSDGYFAMGDNSYNSSDSRVWGPVPKANVVGTPLLIYYPFTSRWGPAH